MKANVPVSPTVSQATMAAQITRLEARLTTLDPFAKGKGKGKSSQSKGDKGYGKAKGWGKQVSKGGWYDYNNGNNDQYYSKGGKEYGKGEFSKGGKAKGYGTKGKGKGKASWNTPYTVPPHDDTVPIAWICPYCGTKHNSDFCWFCRNRDCRMPRPDFGAEEYGPDATEDWQASAALMEKGKGKGITKAMARMRDYTTPETWTKLFAKPSHPPQSRHDRTLEEAPWGEQDGNEDGDDGYDDYEDHDMNDDHDFDDDDHDGGAERHNMFDGFTEDAQSDITCDETPAQVKTAKSVLKKARTAGANAATIQFLTGELQDAMTANAMSAEEEYTWCQYTLNTRRSCLQTTSRS